MVHRLVIMDWVSRDGNYNLEKNSRIMEPVELSE